MPTPDLVEQPGAQVALPEDRSRPAATRLASELVGLEAALTPELAAFARALDGIDGAVVAHDLL